jgi:hypothetical protein
VITRALHIYVFYCKTRISRLCICILLQVGLELLGCFVVVNGLVAKPELTGRKGTAMSFDDDKGRYSVELHGSSTSFMSKPSNLLPTVASAAAQNIYFIEYVLKYLIIFYFSILCTTKALLTYICYCRPRRRQ